MKAFLVFAGLLLCGLPERSAAHAMFVEAVTGGSGVRVVYADNAPVAYSKAVVFSPYDDSTPFLTGMTDPNGFFMFRPDRAGRWKVTLDDGMGHRAEITLEIDDDSVTLDAVHAMHRPGWERIVTGISLILGLFGWTAFLRVRLNARSSGTATCI